MDHRAVIVFRRDPERGVFLARWSRRRSAAADLQTRPRFISRGDLDTSRSRRRRDQAGQADRCPPSPRSRGRHDVFGRRHDAEVDDVVVVAAAGPRRRCSCRCRERRPSPSPVRMLAPGGDVPPGARRFSSSMIRRSAMADRFLSSRCADFSPPAAGTSCRRRTGRRPRLMPSIRGPSITSQRTLGRRAAPPQRPRR